MSKITLPNIASGYASTTQLNSALDAIEAEFQNKVLYRDNPTGEPNQMEQDLDMNSNAINNVTDLTAVNITAETLVIDGIDIADQVALSETYANNSAASATASQNSYLAAAGVYDTFDDRYLGPKEGTPYTDNDGNTLLVGALYFNTTSDTLHVWSGSQWILIPVVEQGQLESFKYTATANQTTFSGPDDNGNTLQYAVDRLIVTLNGVVLEQGTEVTATSGTSVVLQVGASASDELNVYAFSAINLGDAQPLIVTTTTLSTLVINPATTDQYHITALASNLTISNPVGSTFSGKKILLRIKDNGTSRTLTWGTAFYPLGAALPTATIAGKTLYLGFIYNATTSKWDLLGSIKEA